MSAQQARSRMAGRSAPGFRPAGSSPGLVMPYDHAASFELKGIPGNIIQDVINISSDGIFVATGIGYGFEEDRARDTHINQVPIATPFAPSALTLADVPPSALIEGFRLNPRSERLLLEDLPPGVGGRVDPLRERKLSTLPIHGSHRANVLQQIKPAEEISFLFSIVDSGTGRELQDEPIHNLASLGRSDGERPFRVLAQPMTFHPRSTVRLQIVERADGVRGTLFIVLYGYKIGVAAASGEEAVRALTAQPSFPGQGVDQSRVIPFDYVSKFHLTGTPGNLLEDEVPINVEGGFITTSIGYGLAVDRLNVEIDQTTLPAAVPPLTTATDLRAISLTKFPTSALQEGIRIRPNFVRIAFEGAGVLNRQFPIEALNRCFERLNRPDDVSFRYSIFDTGTGRELQNQPIHNIAGLGIANGNRPFKTLARPMRFLPRSTIRVTVEERFGRGLLFIVFQGYKLLGSPATAPVIPSARRRER
jgi:hypothetical protein